jgi:hypothetical protein
LFADFLEMTDELQHSGYKDAAAVIAGSTLEELSTQACAKEPGRHRQTGRRAEEGDTLERRARRRRRVDKLE